MSGTIKTENLREGLSVVLVETFEKFSGIYLDEGTSLFETLATISAQEASIPVSASCAALSAQVEHVRFCLELLEEVVRGENAPPPDWDHIWNTVREVTDSEWQASQDRLRDTYGRITNLLNTFQDWDDARAIGGAVGMIAHTAYHLGEIRQALCTLQNRTEA